MLGPISSLTMKPVPHYVKSLAMTIPAVLVGLQISAWIGFVLSPGRQQRADFRAYYYAGEMLRAGKAHQLYAAYDSVNVTSAFIHPAYEALLFCPFSFLPMRTAHLLWIVLNGGVIYFIYRILCSDLVRLRALLAWLPLAILVSYLPINEALMQGQDSLLLALLVSLSFERLQHGRLFPAGMLLGLGTFRFQFLAAIILLFLFWKGWRLIAGFCVTALPAFLLSSLLVGTEGQRQYLRLLKRLADPSQQPMTHMVNLRAFMTALGVSSTAILFALSVCALLFVAWLGRGAAWHSRLLLAVAASCLLSYHAFLHDLSLLIVPLMVTCDRALEKAKYLNLGILALVLAFPTFLAMVGLPLWANCLASTTMLAQIILLEKKPDSTAMECSVLSEAAGN
jgi:hypothetical protein